VIEQKWLGEAKEEEEEEGEMGVVGMVGYPNVGKV